MESKRRLVILASGNGSNAQAIIDACSGGSLQAEVMAVVSDNADAGALVRAHAAELPAVHVGRRRGESRGDYDARLADIVTGFDPDWVVLAGWMRVLTLNFLGWFPGMVVNLHPALPGQFAGLHAIDRAFEEAQAGTRSSTGVMVHLVPDEGVDVGPVLATAEVPILEGDTLDDLEQRMHAVEHLLLVDTLRELCSERRQHPRPDDAHLTNGAVTP